MGFGKYGYYDTPEDDEESEEQGYNKDMKKHGVAYWDKKLIGIGGVMNDYIKYKYAVDYTEAGKPICVCVTCGKRVNTYNLQNGHWQSRRHKSVAYDEHNMHPQCGYCNEFMNGNYPRYEDFIVQTYGKEERDRLRQGAYTTKKWQPYELEEMYNDYKQRVKELKSAV